MSDRNWNGKWHINSRGESRKCTASIRACPCGEHFDTQEAAQQHIDRGREAEHGLLPFYIDTSPEEAYEVDEVNLRLPELTNNSFDELVNEPLSKIFNEASTKRELIDEELSILESYRMNPKSAKEKRDAKIERWFEDRGPSGPILKSFSKALPKTFSVVTGLTGSGIVSNLATSIGVGSLFNIFKDNSINGTTDKPAYEHRPSSKELKARKERIDPILQQKLDLSVDSEAQYISMNNHMYSINNSIADSMNNIDLRIIPEGQERDKARELLNKHIENIQSFSITKPDGVIDERRSNYNKLIDRMAEANDVGENRFKGLDKRDQSNYILHSIGLCEDPYLVNSKGRKKSYYESDQKLFTQEVFKENYRKLNSNKLVKYETNDEFESRVKSSEIELKDYLSRYFS